MIILDQALQLAANACGAVKEFFGFQSKKLDLRNTQKIQQNVEAQREAAAVDKTRQALAKGDLEELRKEAAE
jgi:hypothetical protein